MENASKALIIAGAILISILLITLGIAMFRSSEGTTEQAAAASNVMQTGAQTAVSDIKNSLELNKAFNNQFTKYDYDTIGEKVTASEIYALIDAINTSNANDSEHQVILYSNIPIGTNLSAQNGKIYKVKVHINGGENLDPMKKKWAGPDEIKSEPGYIDYIVFYS